MPTPKVKIRKKPTNKRCEKGYPCKTTCISREKNCKEPLKGQATTLALWLKHQEEMLEITNKKRAKVGLTPARMTEYGYITAERTKLPQSAKAEKAIAVPESSVAVSQPEKTAPKNLPDPKSAIADSTPTEFAKSAIARLKSGQILLNPKEGYRIATSGKNDGMYSLSDPNISVQQGGKVQKLTEAEAIAFLNTKSPIPASPEPTPEETTKIAEAELIDRLNKSQSILPINVSYVIDTALDNAFETNSLSSLEIIKDANTIADGEKVITYTGYGSGDKQFGIGGGTRSYGFAVWDKAKGKARLSDGYQQGKLSTKHSDYYRVTDKSESIINTDRLLRKLDKEIDAITVNSPDLGNKVKAILDHVRTLPNGTAIAENIISELAKEVTPKSAANQKKIDEAIAPLAELANLRIDEKPKQTKIATDWISLAKSEKQQEESEMRRLQGTPDGLNPIKQPIKGKSVVQIQKQLDQQETGLFLKKHWNSYNLTDKDDILIADFNRINTAVKYLNDPTALHNRQKFLANTRGHEVSHFVRSYEDPRSVGILYNPTKYTASFPVYQQQSPFGMNQTRMKMLAEEERIPRKEARAILSAIHNGKILQESYNSITEKDEIPENLIKLIKIALKQHPDLSSEYPESVNAIKSKDAIAPLAELAKLRTNDTPKQPAIATDWNSLAKIEKQLEDKEIQRLKNPPEGLSPIKKTIEGRSIAQIQKQLDQQKVGLFIGKEVYGYPVRDKDGVMITSFPRIDDIVKYLNDPTALHNRQSYLAATKFTDRSRFVDEAEDSHKRVNNKYTSTFPKSQQTKFLDTYNMQDLREKIAGNDRITRQEARNFLALVNDEGNIQATGMGDKEEQKAPDILLQVMQESIRQHPDLTKEYPDAIKVLKARLPQPKAEEKPKSDIVTILNKSQSAVPSDIRFTIDSTLNKLAKVDSFKSLEMINDNNLIADGEKVITYTGTGSSDKQFGIGGGTRGYGFAVWDKAKGKARFSDGNQAGKLASKNAGYYRVDSKSESTIKTDRLLRKLDKEINAITVNSPDLGDKVGAILDQVRTLPNGDAIADQIASKLAVIAQRGSQSSRR